MTEFDSVLIIQRLYAGVREGNVPAVLDLLADDIRWNYPSVRDVPFAGPRVGVDAVRQFFDELAAADDLEAFEVNDDFIVQGNRVVVLGADQGRVKATGRVWRMKFAHVWTLRDGKVRQVDIFYDTAAIGDAHRA